jgi:hypothetical protein
VDSVAERFRTRLVPALLLAVGVALLASGLLSYTAAVEPAPVARAIASHEPLPTIDPALVLPDGGNDGTAEPSVPPDRVATRVVVPRLDIDLPVVLQPDNAGDFPLCDVAMYLDGLGTPGAPRATYIYAHARTGMFLPFLLASQDHNGAKLIGVTVRVYTSDNVLFLYRIAEVRRHVRNLADALADNVGRLWLQTSEGPNASYPKLQIIADFVSAQPADPNDAHPVPHAKQCQ